MRKIEGKKQNEAEFGELGRLETQTGEGNPAVGVLDGRHNEAEHEQDKGEKKEAVDENWILIERFSYGQYDQEDD